MEFVRAIIPSFTDSSCTHGPNLLIVQPTKFFLVNVWKEFTLNEPVNLLQNPSDIIFSSRCAHPLNFEFRGHKPPTTYIHYK